MKKVSQKLWLRAVVMAVVVALGANVGFAQFGSEITSKTTPQTTKKKTTTKKKPTLKSKPTVAKTVAPKTYPLKAGAKFRTRINEEITSKTARVGDTFTVTVVDPMYAEGGELIIPNGSIINGKVTQVTPAQKGGKVGMIDVEFVSVRLPNGKLHAINGTLTDLSADAKSDEEGQVAGDKMKNRKLIFIGGGGGGGALIGAAIGGGKGAAIGGIVGAVGGLIAERTMKGEEAVVKSGTEFGIYLNKTIYLPKYIPSSEETMN